MCFLISAERTYQESCDDNLPCSRSLECKASGDKKTCQCKQNYKAIEGRCLKGKLNVSLLMYRFTPVLKILKSFDYDFVYIHLSLCICIKHKKNHSFFCVESAWVHYVFHVILFKFVYHIILLVEQQR